MHSIERRSVDRGLGFAVDSRCAVGKIQFVEKLRMAEDNWVRKDLICRSMRLVNPLVERLF